MYRVISDWRCVGVIDFEISDALLRFAFGCVVTLPRGLVVADEEVHEEGFATALVRVLEGVAVDGDAVDERSEGVPVDHVVEVDRQGFALMKRLLDPKVIANPFGVDDAITDAMSHIVFDESMRGDELRSLAFSLRDLKTTRSHSMTQPISATSKSPAPLTASSPSIVRLRRALETDAMASYS